MAHRYEELRLLFQLNCKKCQLEKGISPENLVVKSNPVKGHVLDSEQKDFSFDRSMIVVAIDKNMLKQKAKKITGKRLIKAAVEVAEKNKSTVDNTLTA